jgi:hypothetical protein
MDTFTITKTALDAEYDYWVNASEDDDSIDLERLEADYTKAVALATYNEATDTLTYTGEAMTSMNDDDNYLIDFLFDNTTKH